LPDELAQSMDIGARDLLGNRFNGFSVPAQQQPFQLNPAPMPLLTPAHRFMQVLQEQAQPMMQ
jgi:hypothetical protein